jgi:integrase
MTQLALWSDIVISDVLIKESTAPRSRSPIPGTIAQHKTVAGRCTSQIAIAIDQLKDAAEQYVTQAHAEHTRRAYRSDWSGFERWCVHMGRASLPASSETLQLYLTFLATSGRKTSTIRRARIAIGLAHAYAQLPRPDRDPNVRALERGIGRVHGAHEEGADPLLKDDVARLARSFERTPRGVRDKAIVLLGFAGAFRAGKLVGLNVEHVTFTSDGLKIFLARSKEDPFGRGVTVHIARGSSEQTCPVDALRRWIERVGRPTGPLFRVVHGACIEPRRLHPRVVTRAVQRGARRAGLKGDYSAHSLRSGLATSAYAQGAGEREIQEHGRWKDRRSLDRYIRVVSVPNRRNVADGLL